MRYYIADLHFFHENLNTKMDKRGFANVNAMNDYMLKQWNSKVRNRDEVVILGDLSWGKSEETNQLLQKLNGRLYLIQGNHDHYVKDPNFDSSRFEWIKMYRNQFIRGHNHFIQSKLIQFFWHIVKRRKAFL